MSSKFIIRDAETQDVQQLSVLISELGYPSTPEDMKVRFAAISQNTDYRTLVVADGEELMGMAGLVRGIWYEKNGVYVRILSLVIGQQHRSKGIGKLLIQAIENWAAEIGATAVTVSSGNREERLRAHQFYQRLGYELKSSAFIKQLYL